MRRRPVVAASVAVLAAAGGGVAGLPGPSGSGGVARATAAPRAGCTTPSPRARGAGSAAAAVRRVVRRVGTDPAKRPRIASPRSTPPRRLIADDVVRCKGRRAKAGDTVQVRYVLKVWGGRNRTIDATWGRQDSVPFPLERRALIDGWVEGVPGMAVGGRRVLVIPPGKAYGRTGTGDIPKNATLISVIDLVGIE